MKAAGKKRRAAPAPELLAPAPPARASRAAAARTRVRPYLIADVRRLVRSIFTRADPVDVAVKLLSGGGDATSARTFTLLMEYLYGKPAPQYEGGGPGSDGRPFQFVTHVPRPQYTLDSRDAVSSTSDHNNSSFTSSSSAPNREDDHDRHD